MISHSTKSVFYGIFSAGLALYCAFSIYDALSSGVTQLPIKGFRSMPIVRSTSPQPFWLAVFAYGAGVIVFLPTGVRCFLSLLFDKEPADDERP